ncbi:MAG: DNA repair protein RecN, partial [Boseongicola sp.]
RLEALAEESQILVVTHSPQVAARGAHHWRVEKSITDDVTTSAVTALDKTARIDELARMLSGDKVSNEARAAAQALLSA